MNIFEVMAKSLLLSSLLLLSMGLHAQSDYSLTTDFPAAKHWKIDFSAAQDELHISASKESFLAPEVGMVSQELKRQLDAKRKRRLPVKSKSGVYDTDAEDIKPEIKRSFNGRPLGGSGVPNDNSMAISNDGIIVSAINTTVTILDSDGNTLKFRSLSGMVAGQLGLLDRFYDPKVLYDPIADRFILVFLEGSNSNDTRIIVGFTQSNDPTGLWNFYQINGRPLGGNTWSDYPIIAHNGEDLFITVNLLRDNESWQEGFIESFIWQVNKQSGYEGQTLERQLFSGITYNGKSLWSICPVQPALDWNTKEMYLLSVRPGDASNDTVFLHKITNSLSSGQAEHQLSVLRSNLEYGVPPSAFQPEVGFRLQTNDTRVLSATLLGDKIHFVQSSLVPENFSSGIYHGVISQLNSLPMVEASLISNDKLDYAYPSISYTGFDNEDLNSMLITFSHVGEEDFAGTSMAFHNGLGGLGSIYSDPGIVKVGDGLINTFVADSLERWGDYTDIQRKYNEKGVLWLAGSYGDENDLNNVWIAEILAINDLPLVNRVVTYPNPAYSSVRIAANFDSDQMVDLELSDAKGAIVKKIEDQQAKAGGADFILNTYGLESGMYVLSIYDESRQVLFSQKIVVNQ